MRRPSIVSVHRIAGIALLAAVGTACSNQVGTKCAAPGSHSLRDSGSASTPLEQLPSFNVTSTDAPGAANAPTPTDSTALLSSGVVTLSIGKDAYATARAENAFLKERASATCTATLLFKTVEGVPGAQVTTAAHCFRGMMALVNSIKVDVYDPDAKAYFPTLEAWSPFAERRKAMLADLQAAKFSGGVQELTAWDFMPGLIGVSRDGEFDIGTSCARGAAGANKVLFSEPGSQILCFSGSDLIHFDVMFRNGDKAAPADFLAFALQRLKAQDARIAELEENPAVAKYRVLSESRAKRSQGIMESGMGSMLDALATACSGKTFAELGGSGTFDPLSLGTGSYGGFFKMPSKTFEEYRSKLADACLRKSEYAAIAEKHFRYLGLSPSRVLTDIPLKDPIKDVMNHVYLETAALSKVSEDPMNEAWTAISPTLRSSTSDLRAHFNLVDSVGGFVGPVSVASSDLGRFNSLTQFLWPDSSAGHQAFDTLFVKVPRGQLRFGFAQGDSGTVLSFQDSWPLYVLAAADGAPTSGGASVVNLPRRKPSSSNGETSGNAGNDKGDAKGGAQGKQSTDAGGGCGST